MEDQKQDNYDKFIGGLNEKDKFDADLKQYLIAIKYISEISVESIDVPDKRERINENLEYIVNFVNKYSVAYYEISLVKGFKINEKDADGNWKIDGRDYYYYIADQTMKASVYYVRYLNYIDKHMGMHTKAKETLDKNITEIKNMKNKDILISDKNIISVIDDMMQAENEKEDIEKLQKIRQKCLECVDQIRAQDVNYLKYMLFNNMMREIRYIGAAYQYLWHWDQKTKNLFRNVSPDDSKNEKQDTQTENDCTKKAFLQNMFNTVISHMNKSSGILYSYSEDPYIDIFKYLKISKKTGIDSWVNISPENSSIKIEINNLENSNSAIFEIIKGAKINSVYGKDEPQSFYDFVQGESKTNDAAGFAVELYPELPEREKNSKDTPKNIKGLLVEYLRTWVPDADVKKLMSYVADDKEVVIHRKIEEKVVPVTEEEIPNMVVDGTRYRVTLGKNELIYLLLKINKNYKTVESDVNKVVNKVEINVDFTRTDEWIRKVINKETKDPYVLQGCITQPTQQMGISIAFKCQISASGLSGIENPTLESCRQEIQKNIKTTIAEYFKERYTNILKTEYKAADFILDFIKEEQYECPSYITEYNEFQPDYNDPEISLLKHIIFKRWRDAN